MIALVDASTERSSTGNGRMRRAPGCDTEHRGRPIPTCTPPPYWLCAVERPEPIAHFQRLPFRPHYTGGRRGVCVHAGSTNAAPTPRA